MASRLPHGRLCLGNDIRFLKAHNIEIPEKPSGPGCAALWRSTIAAMTDVVFEAVVAREEQEEQQWLDKLAKLEVGWVEHRGAHRGG